MGGFSIYHWIIILAVLGVPVLIGLVIWRLAKGSKKS